MKPDELGPYDRICIPCGIDAGWHLRQGRQYSYSAGTCALCGVEKRAENWTVGLVAVRDWRKN